MDLGLKDKVFVVGGGSKGLGRGIAQTLVAEGARVLLVSRDEESLNRAVAELGPAACAVAADMAYPGTAEQVANEVEAQFDGRLDGLVVNAGGPPAGKALELSDEQWLAAYQLLIGGPLRLLRALVPRMDRGGAILFITSTSVRQPIPNLDTSNVLRPGVAALAKTLARELAPNIRVNSLAPGRFDTDRIRTLDAGRAEMKGKSQEQVAVEASKLIVEAIHHAGAGHLGGPLSAADILVALYFDQMNVDPSNPDWPERDRFILSKGHSSIALYTVLAMRGYFPVAELNTFDAAHSRLQGHPDMHALPGLEMSTGSLGQGLSPGAGMALGAKVRGSPFRTWVMLGDGEIQEGQIWEAAFTAARYRLDNLTAILDYNGLPQFGWPQAGGFTRETPIDDPGAKFRAFGWHVIECDGHDQTSIRGAFDAARSITGQPTCVVAHTVKGQGVSFMEGDFNWHAKVPTGEQLADALEELDVQLAAIADVEAA